MATVYEKMTAIANNIRSKTGKTDLLNLDDMASSVNEVYDKGYSEAKTKYTSKPYMDTSKITNFLYFCTENRFTADELAKLNTSNGTNFKNMFDNCKALTTIPNLDTSKGTNFYSMFNQGTALTSIPNLDTSNGTNFSFMFNNCRVLTTISKLNLSKATNLSGTFQYCLALENITFEGTITTSINFSSSTKLTHDSLMSIINALADKSSSTGTYKLTIGSTNIAKLTAEELQIIENKGWTYA